jgi:hypothetical protein
VNSRFDVLIGAGLIAVLAVKAPLVIVGGLLCLWWTTSRRGHEVPVEQAARAAMFGGFFVHALVLLLGFAVMSLAFGAEVFSGAGSMLRDVIDKDPQATSIGLFGLGFVALIESFLLGLAVKLLGPWLPH